MFSSALRDSSTTFLFRHEKFAYHVLTPTYRDEVLIVLSRAFVTEPVCSAVAENQPSMRTDLKDWVEFADYWMDHCSSNGLSVVAFDEEFSRIAGAFIVRDLLMVPQGFDNVYGGKNDGEPEKTLAPWMQFLWHMDAEATKCMPELGQPGKAVDLWFLGVHPDYRGNGIANHLTRGVLPLVKKAGFSFATIEATSAFTSKAATVNGFSKVYEMEAKEWLWKGEPLYTNAKPPHGTWTFWVKNLQDVAPEELAAPVA